MDVPQAVSQRLEGFFTARRAEAGEIGPHALDVIDAAAAASSGGKRLRASFLVLGFDAVPRRDEPGATGSNFSRVDASETDASLIGVAAALELFQAAALVHDDLIDNSDTRRGRPAAHRALEALHRERGWSGDAAGHGRSGAVLLGDLLVAYSDDLFEESIETVAPNRARGARRAYATMRRDVTLGQYLDVAEESAYADPAWNASAGSALERALTVASFKSARYSVQQPLLIGAALGGADEPVAAALADFGLAVGMAFQLRDDLLGVFGDDEVTGKPAGDDLREGKRTALIALARDALSASDHEALDAKLGDPSLDARDVDDLRETITRSGAVDALEALIERYAEAAERALDDAPIDADALPRLRALADRAIRRSA